MSLDVLNAIRADLGKGPISRIDEVAKETGISRWTLLKVARGKNPNPRHNLLAKMRDYYARKSTQ